MNSILLLYIAIWSSFLNDADERYSLVITNVTIISIYKNTSIPSVDLFVSKGRIEKIVKHNRSENFSLLSDAVIDGSGKYLLPGLIDCHVHYGDREDLYGEYDKLYLKYGVTKVLALNGSDNLLKHRLRIRNKTAVGPDIYCSSPRNNDPSMTADQAIKLMAEYKTKGFNFIKIYNDLSKESFETFNKHASKNGLRLLGHIPTRIGTFGVLQSNMELVVHAEEFLYHSPVSYMMGEIDQPVKPDESRIDQLADSVSRHKKYVSPTLIAFKSILFSAKDIEGYVGSVPLPQDHPIASYWKWSSSSSLIPKKFSSEKSINRLQYAYDYQLKLVNVFNKKGVPILIGTDSPTIPGLVPGYSLHQEMQILSKAGMSTYEILKSATLSAAQFLKISNDFGTIEVGKEATFILLDKDPLVDIKNTLSIEKVFNRGEALP